RFVGKIDQLRFKRRAPARQVLIKLNNFAGLKVARMFGHAFTHLEGQIQAREASVALLEFLDDSERMNVVIEPLAEAAHLPVQLLFSGVSKRRMADVVN